MYMGDYMKNNTNGPDFSEALASIFLIFLGVVWSYFSISNRHSLIQSGVDPFIVMAMHICGFILVAIGIFLLVYKLKIKISLHKKKKKSDLRIHRIPIKNTHKKQSCPHCGFELEEEFKFCPECGQPIDR